jgi:flagellin-like protein
MSVFSSEAMTEKIASSMQFKRLLTDDDAVSPVIGVILMVAITVLLAATVASFVLGFGDQNDPGIRASFDFDYDSDWGSSNEGLVTVTYNSGDEVTAQTLYIRGEEIDDGKTFDDPDGPQSWDNLNGTSYGPNDVISAGKSANIIVGGNGSSPNPDEYVINIVWEDPGSSSTVTLDGDAGPDA